MAIRLIAGRAGAGKTHQCLQEIAAELARDPVEGPRLVLLVPDQATLQMERALLAAMGPDASRSAVSRCEVLSFRRLARRILQESGAPSRVTLSPLSRQMALRHLIGRHANQLREFESVAERSGFVAGLATTIAELLQEGVTLDELDAAATSAEASGDPSAVRLQDLATLHRAYLEYLGSERVDPDGVLDLARARLDQLAWPRGAKVWLDGFAGLTRQQQRMVVALAERAAAVRIALLLDPADEEAVSAEAPPDEWSLFARTERTWFHLVRAVAAAGVPIEPPLLLGRDGRPRFCSPGLASIEAHLFEPGKASVPEAGAAQADLAMRLIRAKDRRVEVQAAVNALVDLVTNPTRPMRLRDTAIIVRNLEPYHDLVSSALTERGIPFFIDRRRETHHHPLIGAVRAALALHGAGESFGAAVAMLLKTGLTGIDDAAADGLENYVLAYGLRRAEDWATAWTHPVDPDNEPGEEPTPIAVADLAEVNRARERLASLIAPWRPMDAIGSGVLTCRAWVEGLYGLLTRMDIPTRLAEACADARRRGDLDEVEEHEQIWSELMTLFDELVAALGEEAMSARRLREVVESALAEFTLGLVPPTVDQVLVGSIERSRHPSIRAAFVLGFGDGQFPARVGEDPILGDDERAVLARTGVELSRSRAWRLLDERMLAYIALTRASERLWVSYPAADEQGKRLEPSGYWETLKAAAPGATVEDVDGDRLDFVGSAGQFAGRLASGLRAMAEGRLDSTGSSETAVAYERMRSDAGLRPMLARAVQALRAPREAELDDAAREALWRAPLVTSVTRLEQFAQCPFQHFAAHGLRLRPRAEHAVSAVHLGRLYHAVLEQFVNELNDRQERLRDLSADEIGARLKMLTESGVKTFADAIRLDEADAADARRRGGFDLPSAMQGQQRFLAPTPLAPAMTEQVFGGGGADDLPALTLRLGDGRLVQVRGKIDRVDFVTAGDRALAVVFDYKRKIGERLRLAEAYHGLALQLLTYLLVLRDGVKRHGAATIVPGGAFYLPLIGRYKSVEHPSDADDAGFNPFALFQPRGVLDYDWLDSLDPTLQGKSGRSAAFAATRKKADKDAAEDSGGISDLERSDAVPRGVLPALLEHVRHALTDLAERWAAGEIAVWPVRLDDRVPCPTCRFGGVCRVEPSTRRTRSLESLSRKVVIARLQGGAAQPDTTSAAAVQANSKSEEQPESSKTRVAKPKVPKRKGGDRG